MDRSAIYETIFGYLALLNSSTPGDERVANLVLALDRLALAYHFANCDFDEGEYADAPTEAYFPLRSKVENLFPDFGLYNVVTDISVNVGVTTTGVGDALDDLTDIAVDMYEVLWLWENTSVENALWQFRWGYENHWGGHLRNLQLYLWANRFGV